jgi:methionyl-tRNA formyltransferase
VGFQAINQEDIEMIQPAQSPLRIVTFNNFPPAFQMTRQWLAQAGHQQILTVTTPGPTTRRSEGYKEIVASAPPELDVLVTTRLRTVALPLIRELRPDLILAFSFPYRIPPEIRGLARLGAVNLHPAPLPAYRGPNVFRGIFDGYPQLGATLHWMDDDFDTGRVLSRQTMPLPVSLSLESLSTTWAPLIISTIDEGVARAVAGQPGNIQDETGASYGAPFTDEEHWLNWEDPGQRLHQKCFALTFGAGARAKIAGAEYAILQVTPLPDGPTGHAPGSLLDQDATGLTVACGDGTVRVVARSLTGS